MTWDPSAAFARDVPHQRVRARSSSRAASLNSRRGSIPTPLFIRSCSSSGVFGGAKEVSIVWRIIFSALAVVGGEHRTRIRLTMAQRATTSCMLGLVLTRASAYVFDAATINSLKRSWRRATSATRRPACACERPLTHVVNPVVRPPTTEPASADNAETYATSIGATRENHVKGFGITRCSRCMSAKFDRWQSSRSNRSRSPSQVLLGSRPARMRHQPATTSEQALLCHPTCSRSVKARDEPLAIAPH